MGLIPAYGRDYKSKKEVEDGFNADHDFQIADMSSPDNGRYVQKSELVKAKIDKVQVRYKNLTQVVFVKVQ